MITMTDEKLKKDYGAVVESKFVGFASLDIEKTWLRGAYLPTVKTYTDGYKQLSVKVRFTAKNRDEAYRNASAFFSAIADDGVLWRFRNLPHLYESVLDTYTLMDTEFQQWIYADLQFWAIERTAFAEYQVQTGSMTFTNNGTAEAPALIIVPAATNARINFGGQIYDINNKDTANPVVIDGRLMTIVRAGKNVYKEFPVGQFPSLKVGNSMITTTAGISFKFAERWR